ncbi:MAG: S-layer homology domain-containing protein, partial [Oscillospiraceae bacterium]|nr:S-layer homology domain-containing protein [Oscillospiraceae bacterium]
MHTTSRPRKRLLATIMAVVLVLSLFPAAAFAATTTFTDVPSWAQADVDYLYAKSLTSGVADGKFGATQELTGYEFFVFADRALKLSGSTGDWDAQKAAAVSALKKYGIDTADAGSKITREVVFADLAILLGLADKPEGLVGWSDADKVSSDLKGKVGAFVAAGYVAGTSSGEKVLNPQGVYTRQEYAGIFHRVLGNYINKAGTTDYTKLQNTWTTKNLTVEKADTQIKNGTLDNLIIGAGVGEGTVYLADVTVKGTLVVFGGGSKSIKILGKSNIANIVIAKIGTPVRIAVLNTATVGAVTVNETADAIITGKVTSVTIEADATAELTAAAAETVTLSGEAAEVTVTNSKVTTITATAGAAEAVIAVKGSVVTTITNAAPDSEVGVTDSAVKTISATGEDATTAISGTSVVQTVTIGADAAAAAVTGTAKTNATDAELTAKTTAVTATADAAIATAQTEIAAVSTAAAKAATVDTVDAPSSGGSGGTGSTGGSSGPSPEPGAPSYVPPVVDSTAPTIGASGARSSDIAGTISVLSNEAGSVYYKVVEKDDIAPLAASITTALTPAITANTSTQYAIVLTAGAKDVYVVVKDAAGNISTPQKVALAAYVPNVSLTATVTNVTTSTFQVKVVSGQNPALNLVQADFKLNGVEIIVSSPTEDGVYTVTKTLTKLTPYTLTLAKTGYEFSILGAGTGVSPAGVINIPLDTYTVSGTVKAKQGDGSGILSGLNDATIKIGNAAAPTATTSGSDSNAGKYSITGVPENLLDGTTTFNISADG